MATSQQATEAGNRADEIIKQLANPSQAIVTDKATVEVLDKAKPVEPTPVVEDTGNWKNRFTGYKASTDKTLHELRQRVNQFDLIQSENETLKKNLETAQGQIPTTPSEMLEQFSQEEVDSFTKMVDGRVGGLQSEVERLQTELGQVRQADIDAEAQVAHQSIIAAVAAAVPSYQEIDVNPAFKEWIDQPDMFGNVRYDLFMRAKQSSPPDVGRIVQFYVDFANETASAAPAQEEPQMYTQQELLQNPASTPSVGVTTPQGLNINWDQPTISKLYSDKAKGNLTEVQFKELEEDMYKQRLGKR